MNILEKRTMFSASSCRPGSILYACLFTESKGIFQTPSPRNILVESAGLPTVNTTTILRSGRSLAACAMPDQDEHEDSSETTPTVLRPTTQQPTAPHPAATNRTVVLTQPRDPGTFSGSDSTDVEE